MSKPFRWLGPGIFTDFVGGKAVASVEGDVVREHTVDPEKLDAWVKASTAEYINLAENVASKLGGSGRSDESKRESELLQRTADQTAATQKIQVLGQIRQIMADPLFTDEERMELDAEFASVSAEYFAEVLESTKIELERRQKTATGPRDPPKPSTSSPIPPAAGPKTDASSKNDAKPGRDEK